MCLVGVRSPGFPVFWLVRYLGVGGCWDLWALLLGCSELWVCGILVSWVYCTPGFGFFSTLGSPALCVDVYCGRMVLRFFLGSHGTLVAVSAPLMMPLRDSDIPMNVPFTFSNKQPIPQ